jgi:hypothetical protein
MYEKLGYQGMAQIIDMEERRKPRAARDGRIEQSPAGAALDPLAYVDQLAMPLALVWRSWFAAWTSLWLAPFGLQVSSLEAPPLEPKDRVGPRR